MVQEGLHHCLFAIIITVIVHVIAILQLNS